MSKTVDLSSANVLVPTQTFEQVSPWHAARTSIVSVNPDPDSGDVFKVGTRYDAKTQQSQDLYCLAKPALMRIAAAAGIIWNWRESGIVSISRDYVCYKAVAALRLPDGSLQPILATKEIDLEVIQDELRVQYENKVNSGIAGPDVKLYAGQWRKVPVGKEEKNLYFLTESEKARYVETYVHSAMIQWRKNKLMRAETGAMLRVIRAGLGIKSQYTKAELQRPFVVPRIDFSPDYSDPEVRNALLQHGVQAMSTLYGQSAPVPALGAGAHQTEPLGALPDHGRYAPVIDVSESREDDVAGVWEAEAEPAEPEAPQGTAPAEAEADTLFGDHADISDVAPEPAPALVCSECGKGITQKVNDYSSRKFGRPLCYGCQKGAVANG